jgi:hypothetical protein
MACSKEIFCVAILLIKATIFPMKTNNKSKTYFLFIDTLMRLLLLGHVAQMRQLKHKHLWWENFLGDDHFGITGQR